MPELADSSNKRRRRGESNDDSTTHDGEPTMTKRRAFLQTMGQQLRDFGPEISSPRDHNSSASITSPSSRLRPGPSNPEHHIETPESDAVPGEDSRTSKWLWAAHEVAPVSTSQNSHNLSFEDLLDFSQSYFDYWHPAFPFAHAPSLLEYFREVTQQQVTTGQHAPAFQHIILRAVLSISLMDRRQIGHVSRRLPSNFVFHSYNDAVGSLQLSLIEETSTLSLQAVLSVQLFLISMLQYNSASRLEGLAVRMAFQLSLHHCPARNKAMSSEELALRKRLFWSIYCIDRYICIRLGIPMGIRNEDTDVCYPNTEKHSRTEEEASGKLQYWLQTFTQAQAQTERDNRLDLLEYLSRHASIRGSIMELRNRSNIDAGADQADDVATIEAKHSWWWNDVDEYLSNCEQTQVTTKLHQVILIVLRFESIIAIHRSTLATSQRNASYTAALQRCISASRSIINTLHKALQGFGAFDGSPGQSGYESTPLLWPSFTWAVWMSAFIVIFAATENQISTDVACRLAERSIEILKHLSLRGTNWPEACTLAIRNMVSRLTERSRVSTRSSTAEPSSHRMRSASQQVHAILQSEPFATSMNPPSRRPNRNRSESRQDSSVSQSRPSVPPRTYTPMQPAPFLQEQRMVSRPMQNIVNYQNPDPFQTNDATYAAGAYGLSNPASAHLIGAGTFLGIAQQMSDNPLPNDEIINLFNNEDMSWWIGDDFDFQ